MKEQLLIYLGLSFMLLSTVWSFPQGDVPDNIEELFDRYTRDIIELNPEIASEIGITEEMGFTVKKDELTDVSEQAIMSEYNLFRTYNSWLKTYNKAEITLSQQLDADILYWYHDTKLQGEKYRHHQYIINHLLGIHNALTSLMTEYHTIETFKDAEDYISRLGNYSDKFKQLLEGLKIREEKGIIPPIFIIEKMDEVMSDFISVDEKENLLYTSFRDRVKKLQNIDEKTKERLYQSVEDNIKNCVYPSYRDFIAHLKKLQQKATYDAGVWKLPDGDKYYEYCLRYHTTTTLSPEEIHQIGIKEVERIQKEMKELLASLGFTEGQTFGEIQSKYWTAMYSKYDERFQYPESEEGRKQALRDYQAIIYDVEKKLPQLFPLIPKAPVIVMRVPDFQESTLGTFYQPPPLDGSREGIFYANLSRLPFKPGMKTLTYHESIPGHHFQFAIEREAPNYRIFRSIFFFTAYAEGWALYAEKLAKEQGWYEDVYTKLGYLNSELFRAVRLVVDTGIHYKRWSRDRTYNYMVDNLGWGSYRQINRYCVWPGQACAYKIGELKMLELRERAKTKLGDRFDIKEFHRVILQHGSAPLEILERIVDEWIES